MEMTSDKLNERFKVGDYASIMQTTDRTNEGTAGMICKLIRRLHTDEFMNDCYHADIECSNHKTRRITITTAEMNPVTMQSLAWGHNTHFYWRFNKS